MALHKPSTVNAMPLSVQAAILRRTDLSLAKNCSIGLKSGLSRNHSRLLGNFSRLLLVSWRHGFQRPSQIDSPLQCLFQRMMSLVLFSRTGVSHV
jgi:hypothetical protein